MLGLCPETPGLLGNEGAVVEIIYLHGFLDLIKGCLCCSFSHLAALLEYVIDRRDVPFVLFPPGPDWFEFLVEDLLKELLAFDVSKTALLVMGFEFVQIGVVRPVKSEMLIPAESIKVGEDSVAFDVTGITDTNIPCLLLPIRCRPLPSILDSIPHHMR